jgi:hypothetical protein
MTTMSDVRIPSQEREHAWRLTRSYLLQQGIDLRLTKDAAPFVGTVQPIRIALVDAPTYAAYREEHNGGGSIGCANLLDRVAFFDSDFFSSRYETFCSARRTVMLATGFTHEIAHLLGLVHVESVSPRTTIPINDWFLRPNIMVKDSPSFESAITARSLCGRDLATLTAEDLPIALEPIQRAQMRSAATGGRIWELMRESGFDYFTYEGKYRNALLVTPQ